MLAEFLELNLLVPVRHLAHVVLVLWLYQLDDIREIASISLIRIFVIDCASFQMHQLQLVQRLVKNHSCRETQISLPIQVVLYDFKAPLDQLSIVQDYTFVLEANEGPKQAGNQGGVLGRELHFDIIVDWLQFGQARFLELRHLLRIVAHEESDGLDARDEAVLV